MSAAVGVSELLSLLEEERRALLDGRYDQLETFARVKASGVRDLESLPHSDAAMEQLRSMLERNAALLQSALAGMQEARATILGRREPPTLSVYGPGGERQAMHIPLAGLERKA